MSAAAATATNHDDAPGPERTARCKAKACGAVIVWFYRANSPGPPALCCECKAEAFRDRGIRLSRKH